MGISKIGKLMCRQQPHGPRKLYPYSNACLAARYVEKFHKFIPLGPKVITANTLNLKPIFEFSLFEIVGGTSAPGGSKPWSYSSTYKNGLEANLQAPLSDHEHFQ